jgi:hypothetical protein
MTRVVMATTAAALLVCGPAFAQVSPGLPPLEMTSPLGFGSALPVPPTRIPLGATGLGSPGVSPLASGASPVVPLTGTSSGCSGIGGSIAESSYGLATSATASGTGISTPSLESSSSGMGSSMYGTSSGTGVSTAGTSMSPTVFDGGGVAGSASGTCPSTDSASLAGPAASASSPTGMGSGSTIARVGVPLGSTELGAGGLSPAATIPTTNPAISTLTTSTSTLGTIPCPTTGLSTTTGTSSTTGITTATGSC